ncbi:hypothetical protein K3720_13285 [Leisingera caerulea]|uniref:hypothetical protein n=1 Tax=Leisingera caerulea TaxID=506591 RepID=UPI0021A64A3E|nr:hypothetical protein [Leisingera caerulea]UWQ48892.1 hypothetical protein K3720_13285 [Leisingera caerulea]
MFLPVSGRVDPVKPNRGHLTARPVVRSDDPDRSESANTSPREQEPEGHPLEPSDPNDGRRHPAAPGGHGAEAETGLPPENPVLAEHLLLQRAEHQSPDSETECEAACHGYEAAKTLSA